MESLYIARVCELSYLMALQDMSGIIDVVSSLDRCLKPGIIAHVYTWHQCCLASNWQTPYRSIYQLP